MTVAAARCPTVVIIAPERRAVVDAHIAL